MTGSGASTSRPARAGRGPRSLKRAVRAGNRDRLAAGGRPPGRAAVGGRGLAGGAGAGSRRAAGGRGRGGAAGGGVLVDGDAWRASRSAGAAASSVAPHAVS